MRAREPKKVGAGECATFMCVPGSPNTKGGPAFVFVAASCKSTVGH